ncbi:MAG: response regulator [Lacibacter sp.]
MTTHLNSNNSQSSSDNCRQILLADDDLSNAMITEHVLQMNGYSLKHVLNGKEAVAAFQQEPDAYVLILMDVQMPEMDGIEATRTIRFLNRSGAAVPILGLTASVLQEDIQLCYEAGMNAYMFKPYDPDKLMNKIRELISPKKK